MICCAQPHKAQKPMDKRSLEETATAGSSGCVPTASLDSAPDNEKQELPHRLQMIVFVFRFSACEGVPGFVEKTCALVFVDFFRRPPETLARPSGIQPFSKSSARRPEIA